MAFADLFAGAPFRATLQALALFVTVLFGCGVALHERIGTTMRLELEERVVAELVLLRDIFERGGREALVRAIADLEGPVVVGPHVSGVFDENGQPLAGTLDVAPDVIGWSTRTVARAVVADTAEYRLRVERWRDTTIAVGHDTSVIRATLDALMAYLVLGGLIVTVTSLALGLQLSRRTRHRLAGMADALDRVARGDLRARLPPVVGDGQIARISERMNVHLDELARVTDDTRNTIGNVAHDLRTPLNRASVKVQEAATAADAGPSARALAEAALDELDALDAIFETILRIGRIRSGDGRETFGDVDVGALLAELAETFEPVLEDAGQRLVLAPSVAPSMSVWADRRMVAQLLVNLVSNASRHGPPGTCVTLGASRGEGGATEIVVSDDGPGIAAEARTEVLRPFVRLDASRGTPGSGLGLALVAAVARRHGAELRLEDAAPGLRVVIAFPPP